MKRNIFTETYETPVVEIVEFDLTDIITTSLIDGGSDGDGMTVDWNSPNNIAW